jgi:hypothetical protein
MGQGIFLGEAFLPLQEIQVIYRPNSAPAQVHVGLTVRTVPSSLYYIRYAVLKV